MNRALVGAAALLMCVALEGQDISTQIREGNRLRAARQLDQAEKVYREALGSAEGVLRAAVLNNLGAVYYELGNHAEAEKAWREAVEIFSYGIADTRLQYATALINLAELHRSRGDLDTALQMQQKVLAIREELSGARSLPVASTMNAMALLCMDKGDAAQAVELLTRALDIRAHLKAPADAAHGAVLHNLGESLRLAGRLEEAKSRMTEALELRIKLFGEIHAETATTLANLGALWEDLNAPAEAAGYALRALDIRKRVLPPQHPNTVVSLNNAGHLLTALGRGQEALSLLDEALAIVQKDPNRINSKLHAVVLLNLADCHLKNDRGELADPLFRESIGIFARSSRHHPEAVPAYAGFARLLISQGRLAAAEKMLQEAIGISKLTGVNASAEIASLARTLALVLRAQRRDTEAEKLEKTFR